MFGRSTPSREARLRYLPSSFQILSTGDHVLCAQSGVAIPLAELRYWSAERQEAYAGPAEASAALLPPGEKLPG